MSEYSIVRSQELFERISHSIAGGESSYARLRAGIELCIDHTAGARIWDVDGNEYIDLMCSYGPIVLGHGHPKVEAAAQQQRALADCQNTPSPRIVELAESLVATVAHADWAIFGKNGTDATTICLIIPLRLSHNLLILATC